MPGNDSKRVHAPARPIAVPPHADTASASRDHIVTVDPDGMITVTGERRACEAAARAAAAAQGRIRPCLCTSLLSAAPNRTRTL